MLSDFLNYFWSSCRCYTSNPKFPAELHPENGLQQQVSDTSIYEAAREPG